jgi:hypothetical protein
VSVILNKLIRASLIATVLTTAGVIANTNNAFAEPVDQIVNFSGTVAPTCAFSNVQNGLLGVEANPAMLSENGAGGMPGFVDLACNSGAQVSVTLPVNNGSSVALTPTWQGATAQTSAGQAFQDPNGSTPQSLVGPVQETVRVGMYLINGSTPIPAGTYNYNVTVTATPQ